MSARDQAAASRARRLARLERRLAPVPAPLGRRLGAGPAALSFGQERLFFVAQLAPTSVAYNVPFPLRLEGPLDLPALRRSLAEIVRRHEVLRSTLVLVDGVPCQVVRPELPELPCVALADAPAPAEQWLRAALTEDALRPFDLSVDVPLRARLLRVSPELHVLSLVIHHVAWDAWSAGVFLRELLAGYAAAREGRSPEAGEPALQYADYAVWQRATLRDGALEEGLAFWQRTLQGAAPLLELPCERPRSRVPSAPGVRVPFSLPGHVTRGLRALAHETQATLFMTLLAAWQLYLARLCGTRDVCVATPMANRGQPELGGLIGFFVNLVVVRLDLSGNPTFRELVTRVRSAALPAFERQDVPFERVVERLSPTREALETPFCRAVFTFQNAAGDMGARLSSSGLTLSLEALAFEATRFDLLFGAGESGGCLYGALEYRDELWDGAGGARLAAGLQAVLARVAADPQVRVDELDVLSDAERARLAEWNQTARRLPCGSLAEAFEEQAARQAERVALLELDAQGRPCGELTYAELRAQARALAWRLRAAGVTPDTLVGVCAERSRQAIVGLLATVMAGGAYVPLDPAQPAERLSAMLEDSGLVLLLGDERSLARLPAQAVSLTRIIPLPAADARPEPREPALPADLRPDHLAYVTYTSGSTGTPKGVAVTQRGVLRLVAPQDYVSLCESDVVLHLAPLAFDASTFEIWGALLRGARLVLAPPGAPALDLLARVLREQGVSVLWLTAPLFHLMVDHELAALRGVRQVLAGGDVLSPRAVRRFLDGLPVGHALVNGYGPTENTTFTTCERLDAWPADAPFGVPIGRPIANTRVHVLDAALQPVPLGVTGELCAAGEGLARGYWGQPALTAERFLPDPLGPPGTRLYRTGDLARVRGDGRLEFLGRADGQVKLRGLRVECGEIEAALLRHPDLATAVVVARGAGDDKTLVAYFVPLTGRAPTSDELRAHLERLLPDYMVPGAYVRLEGLPLTPTGKLDRAALPAPTREEAEAPLVAPRNPSEQILAEVFAEVLGLERVGLRENYFDLGGDSIRSLRLRALAEERGLHFALQDLFLHPTVESLAEALAGGAVEHEEQVETRPFGLLSDEQRATLPDDVEDAYPLTQLQAGMLFHSELETQAGLYHDVVCYLLAEPFDEPALRAALHELVAAHPALRTRFDRTRPGEPLQLVLRAWSAPLQVDDLRALDERAQAHWQARFLEQARQQPFDWRFPPLRVHVQRLSAERLRLTLDFHHALLDGWSEASLLTELLQRYAARRVGRALPVAALRTGGRDFVALERQALASEAARTFWLGALEGFSVCTLPRLPGAHDVSGAGPLAAGGLLTAELSASLRRCASRAGVPLKTLLLAAHVKALSVWCGQRDVLTGMVLHGRPPGPDGARALGLFLNTLPLRVRLRANAWLDLARDVLSHEQALHPHRRYPLAALQRLHGGATLFESAFNFTHFHVYGEDGGEATARVEERGGVGRTHFALACNFALPPGDARLVLMLEGSRATFDEQRLEELHALYLRVLTALVSAPETAHDAQALGAPQPARAAETPPFDPRRDLPELFAEQVARRPEATAVEGEGGSLTYAELERRATRLAGELLRRGVRPDALVGLLVERTPAALAALLAVLQAGAAYLPLDPALPDERLRLMLADSGARLVVADAAQATRVPAGLEVLRLEDWADGPTRSASLRVRVDASHLAYVLYTSGSTGVPKGAAVTRRGVLNLFAPPHDALRVTPGARVLQFSSWSFDASLWEMWSALLAGGTLVIAGRHERELTGEAFSDWLAATRIEVAALTPSFVAQLDPARCPGLRLLMLGGEACPPSLAERWAVGRRVVNCYGPTEATCYVTVEPVQPPLHGLVPIGRPIANTRLYVLDELHNPAPAGTPGELCVAGVGLARGYWKRAELTAERFVPDPFATEPGGRLYRTGDRVRLLPDGRLEFLGRLDGQIKLRGLRVELGEIEELLRAHADLRDALVLPHGEGAQRRLVAYVLPRAGRAPGAAELQAHLRLHLPLALLPAAYVSLEAWPTTISGKLDRRALPPPAPSPRAYEPPRGATEQRLAQIWAELLGQPRVARDDDFFALGGHSLLATQVTARARAAFGVELPLRALFDAPLLQAYAALIAGQQPQGVALALVARARPARVPLSLAQRRLWFLEQLEPGRAEFNVPLALRLRGALAPAALERALASLARRHETLRTRLPAEAGEPWQALDESCALPLVERDLSALAGEERERALREELLTSSRRPFDLSAGPLWRACLLRLADDEHVLLLLAHHAICDGWSASLLVRELAALYGEHAHGVPARLGELPLQYADFALWQSEWLQGQELERQLAYWQGELAEAPNLTLPLDGARRARRGTRAGLGALAFSERATRALGELARRASATPFMVLLAALQATLGRFSGQDDVSVGVPVAGRTRQEVEGLIGCFVNTLVLRGRLAGDPGFEELLARVRENALTAFAHQDVPFEQVVERLQPQRDLSTTPLFQVFFQLHAATAGAAAGWSWPGCECTPVEVAAGAPKFDLSLGVAEGEGGYTGAFEYDAELFDASSVERLARHLVRLLERAGDEPQARLSSLTAMDEAERRQVLVAWNATPADETPAGTLFTLFAAQAARTPQATALDDGRRTRSYAELLARALGLARLLRVQGVRPGARVGVCLPRDGDLLAALLGIHALGAAYVPLDPAYPQERLELTLADAGAALVLTCGQLAARVAGARAPKLLLDVVDEPRTDDEPACADAQQIAYVISTSGSTGRPKGVAITHRNVAARLAAWRATYGPAELRRVLFSTSLCFDLSVFEIFLPLVSGGCVVVVRDLLQLAEPDGARDVSLVNSVPSAMAELLRLRALPATVTTVNLAGEALPRRLAAAVYATGHVERLYNLYGPSEDTTYSTLALVERDDERPPSIGRPLAHTRAYLLDARGEPVPIGSLGELYLAGAGLARGYLGRPELSAERFVPDPFGAAGERLYRTGDLARWRHDGQLDFLGRADQQLKLRGFRIELGEIEARLAQHPALADVAVVAREQAGAGARLVAYVVAHSEPAPAPAELRAHLAAHLPEHMLPAAYVALARLPRTPNGKLDRRALPAPERAALGGVPVYVAPASPTEELLAGLFASLLGLPRVGRHDDFFALGGHSLLATRAVARVNALLHTDVPLRALFTAPVVADFAALVDAARRARATCARPPLRARAHDGPAPLSFAQQRLWFLDQLTPGSAAYNLPLSLRVTGALDARALQAALDGLCARHGALRTRFVVMDGAPRQVLDKAGPVAVERADLSALPADAREAELRARLRQAASQPFDLASGPPFRAHHFRLRADDHVLLLNVHHVASDGWSNAILVRELQALYEAALRGLPAPWPAPALQYVDYAVWQRDWLTPQVAETQLAYWQARLADAPTLALAGAPARPPMKGFRGALHAFAVPAESAAGLRALARREGATLFMALLAAYHAALGLFSGQDDVCVGTPVAGRNAPELEGLVGFFVNTLVLRLDLAGDPTFVQLLARARVAALEAYEHQDVPFEQVVERLQPARDASRTPLYQAVLQVHDAVSEPALDPGVLELRPFDPGFVAAKFDLSLSVSDTGSELAALLVYDADVYEPESVARLAAAFVRLVERGVRAPETRLSLLRGLDEAQRARVLEAWNACPPAPGAGDTLPAAIAAQAERTPARAAVVAHDETLSYAELLARARGLARRLNAAGFGPGALVGLSYGRGAGLLVGLLGILEAGAAYVPLDPDSPSERLRSMLADCGARALVCEPAWRERWADAGLALFDATSPGPAPAGAPRAPAARDLAYVIYTSGSTGRPKGVGVEHGTLACFARALCERVYSRLSDGPLAVALNSTVAFDASLQPLVALTLGHCVHVVPDEARLAPAALDEYLRAHEVDVLDVTPTQLKALLEAGRDERAPVRQAVLVGGEALEPALWRRLCDSRAPLYFNDYGPTECTVMTTSCALSPGLRHATLGRPLPGVRVYVCGAGCEPVPVGAPGELLIGGVGVGRGYLGRPDLTAERFVPDPFGEPGARLYRSGDLALWRDDGQLEFLGRADGQVKLRGFRIELGEIEAALRAHPGLTDAAVVLTDTPPGERALMAYVVSAGELPSVTELRAFLGRRLPEHMLPANFRALAALPLTSSGKLDRRALSRLESASLRLGGRHVAARTPLERELVELWGELLGRDDVGVHDDFFALGGHSLLAATLMGRLRARFGRGVPLAALFERPTVAALAQALEHGAAALSGELVVLREQGQGSPLCLVPALDGGLFAYRELVRALRPGRAVLGFELPQFQPEALAALDVTWLASSYLQALRRQQPHGPYALAGWSFGGVVAFELARQLEAQGEEVSFLGLVDALAPGAAAALPDVALRPMTEPRPGADPASAEALAAEQVATLVARAQAAASALRRYAPHDGTRCAQVLHVRAGVAPTELRALDPGAAWQAWSRAPVTRLELPADHYALLTAPHVLALAAAFDRALGA